MTQKNPTAHEAERFAQTYVLLRDRIAAFEAAFPQSKIAEKTKHDAAYKVFHTLKVQQAIQEWEEIRAKTAGAQFGIDLEYITAKAKEGWEMARQGNNTREMREYLEFMCRHVGIGAQHELAVKAIEAEANQASSVIIKNNYGRTSS